MTSPTQAKTAAEKTTRPRGGVPSYSAVLRALPRDETRSFALGRFVSLGGDRNQWRASDRGTMAEALIRTEDWLEIEHPAWAERAAIRQVRRLLEVSAR